MSTKPEYVDYVFLIPGKEFTQDFLVSWSNTLCFLLEKGFSFQYSVLYAPLISDVRNTLLGSSTTSKKRTGNIFSDSLKCKRVVFIDSDITWTIKDLEKLLFTDKDFLSGVYPTIDMKTVSIITGPKKPMTVQEFLKKTNLFEAYATGLGFVSCSFDLLSKLKYPWFLVETSSNVEEGVIGEDVYFCEKVKELGFKIWVDPTISVGHVKTLKLVL